MIDPDTRKAIYKLHQQGMSKVRCDRVPDQPGAEMQHDTTVYRVKLNGSWTKVICHALGHANRKAGEERSFWTVETNFLPGRTFQSLEDLNAQALQWATVRMEHRANKKTGLIPAVAFEHERRYLTKLFPDLPPPYCAHQRFTDQYGYVAFQANYYWVPGNGREEVKLLQYADSLKIFHQRRLLAEYGRCWPTGMISSSEPAAASSLTSDYDSLDYMTRRQNIIWLGPTGCGKTGLATSFLLHAIDAGYRGYFIGFAQLVAELYASMADHSEAKVIRKYASYDCLLIDRLTETSHVINMKKCDTLRGHLSEPERESDDSDGNESNEDEQELDESEES